MFALIVLAAAATFADASNDAPQWMRPATQATTNANVAVFRRVVRAEKAVSRAMWLVTALGAFEARVNGVVVSRFLDPGFSQPEKTRFEVSYDVTSMMKHGDNLFEVTVAPSWWRCKMTRRAYPKVGAPLPKNAALRATLRLTYEDGGIDEFPTDRNWLSAYTGPVVDAGIFEGERVDARRTAEGFAASVPCDDFKGEVRSRQGPSCRASS